MSCIKKLKLEEIISKGVALEDEFHIYYASLCENMNMQTCLESLSDLSLAKAYYYMFQSGHNGCQSFRCNLQNQILQTMLKRSSNEIYLCGADIYDTDRFVEEQEPFPFVNLWHEKSPKVENHSSWFEKHHRGECN